jgi:hypothetical protein
MGAEKAREKIADTRGVNGAVAGRGAVNFNAESTEAHRGAQSFLFEEKEGRVDLVFILPGGILRQREVVSACWKPLRLLSIP